MGTKNSPGKFDCFNAAEPDEPMFVLLGRDPTASLLVALRGTLRKQLGGSDKEQLDEAHRCADALEEWAGANGIYTKAVWDAFDKVVASYLDGPFHASISNESETLRVVQRQTRETCALLVENIAKQSRIDGHREQADVELRAANAIRRTIRNDNQ